MKLYEFAFTRAIRCRWTLQELGVDFEAVNVNMGAGEHRQPAFLAEPQATFVEAAAREAPGVDVRVLAPGEALEL